MCFCSLLLLVATAPNFDAQINIAPLLNEINFKSSKELADITLTVVVENPNEAKIEKMGTIQPYMSRDDQDIHT